MSTRFRLEATPIGGVVVVTRIAIEDERGWLERLFDADELADLVGTRTLAAVNRTVTRVSGAVRGLHYQLPPSAEAKFVTCLSGAIFDVSVDVRRGSPSFLRTHGEVLRAEERRTLFIPEGVAHGFQALTDDAELLYFHTARYDQEAERGLSPVDPALGIAWPLPIAQLSARDAGHAWIEPDFEGVRL